MKESLFHHALGVTAMELVQAGHVMVEQQLQHIEQLAADLDDTTPNPQMELLDEVSLLFQLDHTNKDALEKSIEKIDQWLNKSTQIPAEIAAFKDGVMHFRVYLQLAVTFNRALTQKSSNKSDVIAFLENHLKPIIQSSHQQITLNPLLKSSMQSLVHCLQQMKFSQIESRLAKNEPLKERDKTRFEKWELGLKAFRGNENSQVMSSEWLKSTLESHLQEKGAHYINADFSVNKQGIKRFNTLMKAALGTQDETINQDDLALLSILFGREAVLKVMQRYGLKGNGIENPVTANGFKALLLGLAANLNSDELKRLHPKALNIVVDLKASFKTSTGLADPKVLEPLKEEFNEEKQNVEPDSVNLGNLPYHYVHRALGYLRGCAESTVSSSINVLGSKWVEMGVSKLFDQLVPEKVAFNNLIEDLFLLQASKDINNFIIDAPSLSESNKKCRTLLKELQSTTVRSFCNINRDHSFSEDEAAVFKHYKHLYVHNAGSEEFSKVTAQVNTIFSNKLNPWEKHVDQVMGDLENLTFKRFTQKYPAFKNDNISPAEVNLLLSFANGKSAKEQARAFIKEKLTAVYPYARSALYSHILGYQSAIYSEAKQGVELNLPLENGVGANFVVKPIIHDEKGMALTMLSPVEKSLTGDIPLIFVFEGSHDYASFVRDVHELGAGMGEFNPKMQYMERMLKAINQEIDILTKQYPEKKVSIEIFGHSLGGADVYQLLLALQEAMAQNKVRSAKGHQDYVELMDPNNSNGFYGAKNIDLREILPLALDESLGFKKRDYGRDIVEERKHTPNSINAINLDNIVTIKAYAKNGAGCHQKVLSAIAASAAFLGKNNDYHLYDNPLHLSGDAVTRTGFARGLYMADPTERFFNKIINVTHCQFNTLKDGVLNQVKYLSLGRIAPIEVHQEVAFGQGPLSWLQKDAKIIKNTSDNHMQHLKQALCNPVSGCGKNTLVENLTYRRAKAGLYATLALTAALVVPVLNHFRAFLWMMEMHFADVCGVKSPKVKEQDVTFKAVRGDYMAKQSKVLFSYAMQKPIPLPKAQVEESRNETKLKLR